MWRQCFSTSLGSLNAHKTTPDQHSYGYRYEENSSMCFSTVLCSSPAVLCIEVPILICPVWTGDRTTSPWDGTSYINHCIPGAIIILQGLLFSSCLILRWRNLGDCPRLWRCTTPLWWKSFLLIWICFTRIYFQSTDQFYLHTSWCRFLEAFSSLVGLVNCYRIYVCYLVLMWVACASLWPQNWSPLQLAYRSSKRGMETYICGVIIPHIRGVCPLHLLEHLEYYISSTLSLIVFFG